MIKVIFIYCFFNSTILHIPSVLFIVSNAISFKIKILSSLFLEIEKKIVKIKLRTHLNLNPKNILRLSL